MPTVSCNGFSPKSVKSQFGGEISVSADYAIEGDVLPYDVILQLRVGGDLARQETVRVGSRETKRGTISGTISPVPPAGDYDVKVVKVGQTSVGD